MTYPDVNTQCSRFVSEHVPNPVNIQFPTFHFLTYSLSDTGLVHGRRLKRLPKRHGPLIHGQHMKKTEIAPTPNWAAILNSRAAFTPTEGVVPGLLYI